MNVPLVTSDFKKAFHVQLASIAPLTKQYASSISGRCYISKKAFKAGDFVLLVSIPVGIPVTRCAAASVRCIFPVKRESIEVKGWKYKVYRDSPIPEVVPMGNNPA